MRFGLFSVCDHYPHELPRTSAEFYNELQEQARLADRLGFHSFWIAEHHFHEYGAVPRPPILLSSIAAQTKSIKLGAAVAVLPFDNPLRAAEDYAMLDILSSGRLEMGVGSGYLQHEYAGFGIDVQVRRDRFDEALAIIRESWKGETFSFNGKQFQVNSVKLNVQPVQNPAPPIFIAVLRNEAAMYVGRQKMGMMMIPYASTEKLDELQAACTAYKDAFTSASDADAKLASSKPFESGSTGVSPAHESMHKGSSLNLPRIQFGLHCYCATTTAEARAFAGPYIDRYVRTRLFAKQRPFEELIEKNLLSIGDPDEIIRVAHLYESAGLTDFLMLMNFGGLPNGAVQESMRLIASRVIPEFSTNANTGPSSPKIIGGDLS